VKDTTAGNNATQRMISGRLPSTQPDRRLVNRYSLRHTVNIESLRYI